MKIECSKNEVEVSGIALNCYITENNIENEFEKRGFNFHHDEYSLENKSKLTRVPPAINVEEYFWKKNIEELLMKPRNLIIFGLIRENKGFDEA